MTEFPIINYRALSQDIVWSNGERIRASPANRKTKDDELDGSSPPLSFSSTSRLYNNLNVDCVLHLFGYLSTFDIIRLSLTDPRLDQLARDAAFPRIARKSAHKMFNVCAENMPLKYPLINEPLFRQALECIGSHLTELSLNGRAVNLPNFDNLMETLRKTCPKLVCVRLFSIECMEWNRKQDLKIRGEYFPHLKELCLTNCKKVDQFVLHFIGNLPNLEVLMLHCSLSDAGSVLSCKKLRKFSFFDEITRVEIIDDVVTRNSETLRELYFLPELYFRFFEVDLGVFLENIAKFVPNIEGFFLPPTLDTEMVNAHMGKFKALRKIVICEGDARALQWLNDLSEKPNAVEHIALMESRISSGVREIISKFGTKLHTLDLSRLQCDKAALIDLLARQSALEVITIRKSPFALDEALLVAVQSNINLRSITLYNPNIETKFVQQLIDILRKAATPRPRLELKIVQIKTTQKNKSKVFVDFILLIYSVNYVLIIIYFTSDRRE